MMRVRTRSSSSPREEPAYIPQNFREHRLRQFPRKSILLARMVRGEQSRQAPGELVTNSMTKPESCKTLDLATLFEQPQINAHRNTPKCKKRPRPQNFKIALKVRTAIQKLGTQRLIRRRRATNSRNDVSILQCETVVALRRCRLVRESRAVQRLKQKISRAIPGKHASGAISAMRCGRKTQNQQFCVRVAESRHRFSPVFAAPKREPLFTRHSFAVFHQPRTLPAPDNFLVQHSKPVHRFSPLENYHETDGPPDSSISVSESGPRKGIQVLGPFLVRHSEEIKGRAIQ
jgi:hypothetical protein